MKKKMYLIIVIVFMLTSNASAVETSRRSGPMALTIVMDSAWSNEQEMPNYKSLSRQVIASLRPGDYLELIVGNPGEPKLQAAQFIKTGDSQELKNITTLLSGIKCPFLTDVNISKSIDMALNRLAKSFTINSFDNMAVVVFTDGKLSNSDVTKVLRLADEFKLRNWSLFITGTYETNRKLLVAANKGKFEFSLVNEANPAMWIKSIRKVKINEETSKEIPFQVGSSSVKESDQTRYNVTIDSSVSVSKGVEQVPEKPQVVIPDVLEQKAKEPAKPVRTIIESPVETVEPIIETEPIKEKPDKATPAKPAESKAKKINKTLLWLIPTIGALSIFAILLYSSLSKSNKWKSGINSHFSGSKKQEPGTLIAKLNGQTYSLGRSDRVNSIHIGSGPKNTIKIPDKSISNRHVELYRKGNDFMLKNIGASDIAVNGVPVKPKVKHRLVIPSVIKFNDRTKLNLTLLKPNSPEKASHINGAD